MKNILGMLLFSILILCMSSSRKGDTSPIASNENLYVVNIDDAPKEDFISLSTFLQDVETIILETNENCLIGEINSIRALDDYIVIMDCRITESVLVFDKESRFLHKIGQIGQGPGEYVDITDSSIDFENIDSIQTMQDNVETHQTLRKKEIINSTGFYQTEESDWSWNKIDDTWYYKGRETDTFPPSFTRNITEDITKQDCITGSILKITIERKEEYKVSPLWVWDSQNET